MSGIDFSLNPIAPWPLLVIAALAVLTLTLVAYNRRLRGTHGGWRWFAVGLRMIALFMCLLATLRPSILIMEKKKQPASLILLVDSSQSMTIGDEANSKSRAQVATDAIKDFRDATKELPTNLDAKVYRFDSTVSEVASDQSPEFKGRETSLGSALLDVEKRQGGRRIAELFILSDFASNAGTNPLAAARRLKNLQVPIVSIPVGTESAGAESRDIAVREIVSAPSVFVKNQLDVRGTLSARGFADQPIEVELLVEGQPSPVARTQVRVPVGAEQVPITGIKYVPDTPGEKLLTLRAVPKNGEFIATNNEIRSFVTVLSGGLNVFYLQGPSVTWEMKYLLRSIKSSPDIEVDFLAVRRPAQGETGEVEDDRFKQGRYNAFILADLPADHLTPRQRNLLKDAVSKGAGLMMLGGRSSFGPGGWGQTVLADVLPFKNLQPTDEQIEPEGGLRFAPRNTGLEGAFLQIGPTRSESTELWKRLPPLTGANRFNDLKDSATIFADAEGAESVPLMVGMNISNAGRVLAFAGETWVWARATEEGRLAHRRFWRQVIFWLCRKEDQGDNKVKLNLAKRRLAVGERLDFSVSATNAKEEVIPDVRFETTVERQPPNPTTEKVEEPYNQGNEVRGAYQTKGEAGVFRMTVVARKNGEEVGRDSAGFLVYQDDRELENPAANPAEGKAIAEVTGGDAIAPQKLVSHLKSIDQSVYTEYASHVEHRIWDNWPFLLIFTAMLTLEWWLRKRHGWV
jgi:uncharacterized membrane protein